MKTDLIKILKRTAQQKSKLLDRKIVKLCGIWKTDYVLKLTENERPFHLHYVVAQTVGQGSCHYEPEQSTFNFGRDLLGRNVFDLPIWGDYINRPLAIAALDAVFYSLNGKPNEKCIIDGSNIEKSLKRSEIVCREAINIIKKRKPKKGLKFRVTHIGVVGSMIKLLKNNGKIPIEISAADYDKEIVGKKIHGVTIQHGSEDRELVAEADVVIVTGMTMANKTINEIIDTAEKNNTSLVFFAETGANFASEYCKLGEERGITIVVVSEPYPFYLVTYGPSIIKIYRSVEKSNSGKYT